MRAKKGMVWTTGGALDLTRSEILTLSHSESFHPVVW